MQLELAPFGVSAELEVAPFGLSPTAGGFREVAEIRRFDLPLVSNLILASETLLFALEVDNCNNAGVPEDAAGCIVQAVANEWNQNDLRNLFLFCE